MSNYEYFCPRCDAALEKWTYTAPIDHYRCYVCGLAYPFKDLPRRSILRTFAVTGPAEVVGGHASDIYLLESGAPDGYMLEDGSGVLLLE